MIVAILIIVLIPISAIAIFGSICYLIVRQEDRQENKNKK